ncbi:hypothetical protein IG631_18143 [Alternaria alternata]|nr:hypothetical protein IG631_18143 [Alternaria alternata]
MAESRVPRCASKVRCGVGEGRIGGGAQVRAREDVRRTRGRAGDGLRSKVA